MNLVPEKVMKAVEDYPNLLIKQEKLQKRLINSSGRDPEQEIIVLQRLEFVEQMIEIIDYAMYEGELLRCRDSVILEYRTNGMTLQQIGTVFSLSRERIRKILESAYQKIADAANQQNIS
ncbi:sigma factor-like helix-turn-helix DNA-binding protein [Bacillus sp. Hm123]|uniref:sigma factor-like helix-turn-helix DNA-binding protein n=1 Tax=Bacillus sp. Hm123 TaxID=3450745 RepID=UPI003F43CB60